MNEIYQENKATSVLKTFYESSETTLFKKRLLWNASEAHTGMGLLARKSSTQKTSVCDIASSSSKGKDSSRNKDRDASLPTEKVSLAEAEFIANSNEGTDICMMINAFPQNLSEAQKACALLHGKLAKAKPLLEKFKGDGTKFMRYLYYHKNSLEAALEDMQRFGNDPSGELRCYEITQNPVVSQFLFTKFQEGSPLSHAGWQNVINYVNLFRERPADATSFLMKARDVQEANGFIAFFNGDGCAAYKFLTEAKSKFPELKGFLEQNCNYDGDLIEILRIFSGDVTTLSAFVSYTGFGEKYACFHCLAELKDIKKASKFCRLFRDGHNFSQFVRAFQGHFDVALAYIAKFEYDINSALSFLYKFNASDDHCDGVETYRFLQFCKFQVPIAHLLIEAFNCRKEEIRKLAEVTKDCDTAQFLVTTAQGIGRNILKMLAIFKNDVAATQKYLSLFDNNFTRAFACLDYFECNSGETTAFVACFDGEGSSAMQMIEQVPKYDDLKFLMKAFDGKGKEAAKFIDSFCSLDAIEYLRAFGGCLKNALAFMRRFMSPTEALKFLRYFEDNPYEAERCIALSGSVGAGFSIVQHCNYNSTTVFYFFRLFSDKSLRAEFIKEFLHRFYYTNSIIYALLCVKPAAERRVTEKEMLFARYFPGKPREVLQLLAAFNSDIDKANAFLQSHAAVFAKDLAGDTYEKFYAIQAYLTRCFKGDVVVMQKFFKFFGKWCFEILFDSGVSEEEELLSLDGRDKTITMFSTQNGIYGVFLAKPWAVLEHRGQPNNNTKDCGAQQQSEKSAEPGEDTAQNPQEYIADKDAYLFHIPLASCDDYEKYPLQGRDSAAARKLDPQCARLVFGNNEMKYSNGILEIAPDTFIMHKHDYTRPKARTIYAQKLVVHRIFVLTFAKKVESESEKIIQKFFQDHQAKLEKNKNDAKETSDREQTEH